MSPSAPPFSRVTVLAPGRRVDVALPVDLALAELVPMVLELLDEPLRTPDRPEPWRFAGATGGPLPSGATLHELGVLDGEMLRLGPATPPPPAPVFDDPVDALAALAPQHRPDRRWAAAAAVGLALAAAALLSTVRAGRVTDVAVAAGLGVLGAVAALGYAARVARRPGPEDEGETEDRTQRLAAPVSACCAVPLAAAAVWVALPGPVEAPRLVLAAVAGGIAAALGQLAVRAVAPVLVATVVVAVLAGTAATVGLWFGLDAPALAAGTAAVALSAGPVLPRAVLRLAGLPRPVVPADARDLVAADTGPDLLPAGELAQRVRTARAQLAGLAGGCAVSAAVAAAVGASAGGRAGPALAAVVVGVLLLRARGLADAAVACVHRVAGIAAGVVLVGLVAAPGGAPGRAAGAVVLLGAAALGVQALGETTPPVLSPVARRAVDVAEAVLTAAAVPLALVAAGVFAVVRAL